MDFKEYAVCATEHKLRAHQRSIGTPFRITDNRREEGLMHGARERILAVLRDGMLSTV
jgi:hypothetical protein